MLNCFVCVAKATLLTLVHFILAKLHIVSRANELGHVCHRKTVTQWRRQVMSDVDRCYAWWLLWICQVMHVAAERLVVLTVM
jgi:hypothetical protein